MLVGSNYHLTRNKKMSSKSKVDAAYNSWLTIIKESGYEHVGCEMYWGTVAAHKVGIVLTNKEIVKLVKIIQNHIESFMEEVSGEDSNGHYVVKRLAPQYK
jgi:hypothetical protein